MDINTLTEQKEIWKPIPDYEGCYEASSLGRIRSLNRTVSITRKNKTHQRAINGNILYLTKNRGGYLVRTLSKYSKHRLVTAHRMVMYAFVGKSDMQIDHINDIKTDNRLSNLHYVTTRENNFKFAAKNNDYYLYYIKNRDAWNCRILYKGKSNYIGYSKDKEKVRAMRDEFIKENMADVMKDNLVIQSLQATAK